MGVVALVTTPVFVWGLIKTYKTYGTYSDLRQKNRKKLLPRCSISPFAAFIE